MSDTEEKPAPKPRRKPQRLKLMVGVCIAIYGEYAKDVIIGRERGGAWHMYPQDLLQFGIEVAPTGV